MAEIVLDGASTIRFGGVDLTPFVSTITFKPEIETRDHRIATLPSIRLRFRGELHPDNYRTMFGRNHPRIRRMHSAYRQRRRKRW